MSGKLLGWLALVGTLAALGYVSRFTQGKPPADTLYRYGTAVSGVFFYAITLAIVLWIARGIPRRGARPAPAGIVARGRSAWHWRS